jgi:hypothetical protein
VRAALMESMTTDITRKAQTGEPTTNGGHFGSVNRPDATINLWEIASHAPVPTEDQRDRASVEASRRARATGSSGAEAAELTEQLAATLAEQEAAYEAFKRGEPHEDNLAFDTIWKGEARGISELDARRLLDETRAQADRFQRGEIHPNSIIPGYRRDPLTAAREHLREKEDLYVTALECGGKNLSINQSVVYRERRAAEAELINAPF